MKTTPITTDTLASSVIAVPPLARRADLSLNREQNVRLIRHLEAGGVTTLLYGGNAVLSHVALSEYAELLSLLSEAAGHDTLVIPSVGPAYGTMMDQAAVLQDFDFPTVMILPQRDGCTPAGNATGTRRFVEAFGRPAVLYIKFEGSIDVESVKRLRSDGLLSWIKYAIVRDDTTDDAFLKALVDAIGPDCVVSGIGEQPARVHMEEFGLCGYTSGCVCVAPALSMHMLCALKSRDSETADRIRRAFQPLEDLRNSINPVRVLHAAVTLAGIAEMGPVLPLLSDVDVSDRDRIQRAAAALLAQETARTEKVHP